MTNILRIEDYSLWLRGSEKKSLDNINLTVKKGEFVLLTGPSGSGKTLLLLSIIGIIPRLITGKTEGKIYLNDEDVHASDVRNIAREVGIIFQDPDSQLCELIVEDEIAFGPSCLEMPPDEMSTQVEKCLNLMELNRYRNSEVHLLSGGEKQRLALAAVLASNPEVLLLDCPTSNLDPVGTSQVLSTLDKLRSETDLTVIITEPKTDEIIDKIDKMIIMDQGKIIEQGDPREIYSRKGLHLRDELGLWIPQPTEIALNFKKSGINMFSSVPLTVDEFVKNIVKLQPKSLDFPVLQSKNPILDIDNIDFTYKRANIHALKGISCTIYDNDFLAIVGQNGSGKTTLALNVLGLLRPDSGNILFNNVDTIKVKPAILGKDIGYVFQYPDHQFGGGTIYKELALPLRMKNIPEEEIEGIVEEHLKNIDIQVSIEQSKKIHPYSLSMGEKRRLSVEIVLLREPKIMILDEPTYGQDWITTTILMKKLKEINDKGCAIIMITHNMKLVAGYARRVVVMSQGKKLFDGLPNELFLENDVLKQAYLKPPPIVNMSLACSCPAPLALDITQFEDAVIPQLK